MKNFILSFIILAAVCLGVLLLTPKKFLFTKQLQLERVYKRLSYWLEDHVWGQEAPAVLPLAIPFYPQEHALSCEVAALRMALAYVGYQVSEDELIANLTFSAREPMKNGIWGDPDEGFVGNIDGSIFEFTGYGVYDRPIAALAQKYRPASVVSDPTLDQILDLAEKGNPVIVWGLLSHRTPQIWESLSGKTVIAYPGEHARVLMGYTGNRQDVHELILMDPIYGRIRMDVDRFLSDWQTLGNRAVVVYN